MEATTTEDQTTTVTQSTETKTTTKKRKRTRLNFRLAEAFNENSFQDEGEEKALEKILEEVKMAIRTGRNVFVETEIPEGIDETATKAQIQGKVRTSVKKDSSSPYLNRSLTVLSFPDPKTPQIVERKIETVTDCEW